MEKLNYKYEETLARREVVSELDRTQKHYERAAELLRAMGEREHAHKVLNLAQHAAAQKCLLAQAWSMRDAETAA